ncbi:MAG: response regulator [Spirulina sp. SIO3F2]|nr:response regulator [Spirulina sp. SIO3F2]
MKKVLLVDDQARWRKIFKAILKKSRKDLDIQDCDNTEDTLYTLNNHFFDLAILDLRLIDTCPYNVEGLDLMREVKAKSSMTKIILTTAYPNQIGERYQEADAFILKVPEQDFDIDSFQETVNRLLDIE